MIIILRLSMCSWVGRSIDTNSICNWNSYKFFLLLICILCFSDLAFAQDLARVRPSLSPEASAWNRSYKLFEQQRTRETLEGKSYLISGGIALIGGLVGNSVTGDPFEKAVYAVFQTIGVASIGYGAFKIQVGREEAPIFEALAKSHHLSPEQKYKFLMTYRSELESRAQKENKIKAITHGLISLLNIVSAGQQSTEGVKGALYFLGTANMLAAISYTF